MMRALNVAASWIIELLLRPLEAWPVWASLAVVSAATAILLLAITKVASNQQALADARRRMQAGLLELRLFQHEPALFPRIVRDLVTAQGRYLGYALVPMLWASLPLALLAAHLQVYYGHEGLAPGDSTLVIVRVRAGGDVRPAVSLEVSPSLRVESPPVWTPSLREVAWRVRAMSEGHSELRVASSHPPASNASPLAKPVCVSSRLAACDPVRPARGFLDEWRHPAEPRLPDGTPIEAIEIDYPPRNIGVMGFELPWIVVFVVLTGLFMLIGQPLFRVTL